MKRIFVIIVMVLVSTQLQAQFIKEKSIDVSIGLGLSAPYDESDVTGSGFYAQGEYVLSVNKWIDLRPYAGVIFTKMSEDDRDIWRPNDRVTTNAFLFGGKTRITAPIPWVAPYFEIGVGGSIGTFETLTYHTEIDDRGLFLHIPFSLGLELGPQHNVNVEFTYYFHNSLEQYAGAAAIGLSFPLGKNYELK